MRIVRPHQNYNNDNRRALSEQQTTIIWFHFILGGLNYYVPALIIDTMHLLCTYMLLHLHFYLKKKTCVWLM